MNYNFIIDMIRDFNRFEILRDKINNDEVLELEDEDIRSLNFLLNHSEILNENEKSIVNDLETFSHRICGKVINSQAISESEQKFLDTYLSNKILNNFDIDKNLISKYFSNVTCKKESFDTNDLVIATKCIFNFLATEGYNDLGIKFFDKDEAENNYLIANYVYSNNESNIYFSKEYFSRYDGYEIDKKNFDILLCQTALFLLHETFHMMQYKYLSRIDNLKDDELFKEFVLTNDRNFYTENHDLFTIESSANNYAITKLPYLLKFIVDDKTIKEYLEMYKESLLFNKKNSNFDKKKEQALKKLLENSDEAFLDEFESNFKRK